ncbi:hypothetical protein BCR33DRAFT_418965 [Rhizoclosmatium globosum]|uniref:G-protein coupled receptors family 3 profile domain-containing protein n=1 Tax=Rhizoclosmatium globosum TaxID=329046 RepID=A0A1Y2BWX9_9FUNG|nr:hypothetical protein BCR33DRAFT_418965 [Rhizoclosmatium globosum]|eukprot:ORY39157.1 hypothetical protein BCR33DRAFT_418965 [Rhizoclosmatium globosum]
MVTQFIHTKPMVFYGGGTTPPPDSLPQIFDIVDPSSIQWEIIMSLTTIGCLMCAALISFNMSFRTHSAVKAASVTFSSFMTFGSLLAIISNLAYLGVPSVWAEKVKFSLQWMGLGTIMAGMISKNARVCIIYRMGIRARKIFMKDDLWLEVFVGLLSIDLFFTAIRLYFQTFAIVPNFERQQNQTVVTFTSVQTGYEGLTKTHWVYHGILLSVLALIGSLTRDVQPKHNENAIISVFVFAAASGTLFSLAAETSGERETKIRPIKAAIIWVIAIIPVLWHLITKSIGVFFDPKNPPKILSRLTSSIKSTEMRPLSKKESAESVVDGNINVYTKSKGSNRDLLAKCKKSSSLMLIPTGNLAKKTESYQCSLSIIEPYRLFETWIIGNVVLTRINQKRFITFSSKEPAAIAMAFSLERSVEAIVPSKLSCCEEVVHRIELKTANSVTIKLDFADPIIAGSFCAVLNEVLKK